MKWSVRKFIVVTLCFVCFALIRFSYTRVLNPLMSYGPAMNARDKIDSLCQRIYIHWLDNGRWPTQGDEWDNIIADHKRTWRGMRLQIAAKEFGGRFEMDVTTKHWAFGPNVRMRIVLAREDMEMNRNWKRKIPEISDPVWRVVP